MEKKFKNKMHKRLLALKQELIREVIHEDEDFRDTISDDTVKDIADQALVSIDKSLLETLGQHVVRQLDKIDNALMRMENGKYGTCLSCSKRIGRNRLEAIPYAVLCKDCKSIAEKNKKQRRGSA